MNVEIYIYKCELWNEKVEIKLAFVEEKMKRSEKKVLFKQISSEMWKSKQQQQQKN